MSGYDPMPFYRVLVGMVNVATSDPLRSVDVIKQFGDVSFSFREKWALLISMVRSNCVRKLNN